MKSNRPAYVKDRKRTFSSHCKQITFIVTVSRMIHLRKECHANQGEDNPDEDLYRKIEVMQRLCFTGRASEAI
jgi:hypothetical protein